MTAKIIIPEFGIMKKDTQGSAGGRLSLFLSGMYRFRAVWVLGIVFVLLSLATRIALLLQSITDVDMTARDLFAIFGTGLFYDAVTFSYIMVALVIYLALVPEKVFASRVHRYVLGSILFVFLLVFVFTACAEYLFWMEFETRFDFVAVDYLVYRREVTDNIIQSYPMGIILPAIGCAALVLLWSVRSCLVASGPANVLWKKHFCTGAALLILPAICVMQVDDASSRISANKLNNSLALNGVYTFFRAWRANSLIYAEKYPVLPEDEVASRLRSFVATDTTRYVNPNPEALDLQRVVVKKDGPEARPNVVLVVLESMSGNFLDMFGGTEHITPNLDRLAREGLLFTNLYANGTRTVRGLEAITLSVPPTPPESILSRPDMSNLFTINSVFQEKGGYESTFFYGGRSYFDNMETFFTASGFRLIDKDDLSKDEISFVTAWGACDGDIYRRAIREADIARDRGKNFFLCIMTTSNHRPFTYPEGKIDIPSGTGRAGAVKYSDYAIGELIRQASSKPWFDNTLFIFVADHCARSGGKTSIPVDNYHIPCIFYAPGFIKPHTVDSLASQMDIAPTLFDLLNWSYTSRFIGKSIFTMREDDERAFISNHLTLGYLKKDVLVALEPYGTATTYAVDPVSHAESEVSRDSPAIVEAISYYQGASTLFQKRSALSTDQVL